MINLSAETVCNQAMIPLMRMLGQALWFFSRRKVTDDALRFAVSKSRLKFQPFPR
jgi:hypothetical protein